MNAWLARQRYLIDYVLAAMARQKGRAIGLWVVYTLLVFVLASVMLFTHALRQESARVLQHAPEVVVQKLVAGVDNRRLPCRPACGRETRCRQEDRGKPVQRLDGRRQRRPLRQS